MKHFMTKLFVVLSAALAFSVSSQAAPETYTLDPMHSYVLWHISHFDFSHPSGKWLANGTLLLDKDKPQNDKVNVTINVADMITGIPELDKHLSGDLFFNIAQFPQATFVSNKVIATSKTTADIYGTLTVHGVSKPVVLKAKLNKAGINPITNKMTAGFSATTKIKRSDFGMTTLLPGLGDEVAIEIEIEAARK